MSSFGAGTVAIFNSTAEYLVSLSNNTYRWLAAPVGNRASSSYPSLVLISAAHAGTYYRSRLDITSSGTVTTLSIVHAGQPPSGECHSVYRRCAWLQNALLRVPCFTWSNVSLNMFTPFEAVVTKYRLACRILAQSLWQQGLSAI